MPTFLITGANGFFGRHLAAFLDKYTEGVIYGVSRKIPQELTLKYPRITYKSCDLMDYNSVLQIISSFKPDYIFHLAAESSVASSWKNPTSMIVNNIVSQTNLFESVRELKLNPKIIIACSSEEYGLVRKSDLPVNENCNFNPLSAYAVSKVTQDMLGFQYYKSYNMNIVRVRAFNMTGPGRPPNYALSSFAKQIADIEKAMVNNTISVGNLNVIRDYTDVRDAVKAYYLLALNGKPGEVYNLCSGTGYKLMDLLDYLITLTKEEVKVEVDKSRFRPADIPVMIGNNTKIREEISWTPETNIYDTLKDLLNYWRETHI
jgi:GDP-4-dehydro-6-deoxy-D-mannose reductase